MKEKDNMTDKLKKEIEVFEAWQQDYWFEQFMTWCDDNYYLVHGSLN